MSDLISRQRELDEWCTDCREYDNERHCCPRFNRVIRETAEEVRQNAEPRWIPCSERLPEHPENDDYYLVTIQCEHYAGWDDYVTGFAEWTKHGWDELSYYIGQIKVVAWMPLPKPYKEETE